MSPSSTQITETGGNLHAPGCSSGQQAQPFRWHAKTKSVGNYTENERLGSRRGRNRIMEVDGSDDFSYSKWVIFRWSMNPTFVELTVIFADFSSEKCTKDVEDLIGGTGDTWRQKTSSTWRIIPVGKWLGIPLFMSHEKAILEGKSPYLGDLLTMVINHLLIGMLLQVGTKIIERPVEFLRKTWNDFWIGANGRERFRTRVSKISA